MSGELDVFIDGASKGNPGPSGIGVVLCRQGKPIETVSRYIGPATNNIAEYNAFIAGLQAAQSLQAQSLNVFTDSELLARQVNGQYKVKNGQIRVLFEQAIGLMAAFSRVTVRHIPREQNSHADRLATLAVEHNRAR